MADRSEMSDSPDSVGLVQTQTLRLDLPADGFRTESGQTLPGLTVAYETYGERSPSGDNVIFVCHALSGDAHAAGWHDPTQPATRGWWDGMIGPGKGIDTRYYHVICANVLGGCKGTTGPSSVNPATGRPYGSDFPRITVGDMVKAHRLFLKQLGIDRLAAVIGGSFGGMQAFEWAIRYPDLVRRCICVAAAKSLSAQALAFDIVGRAAIVSDRNWHQGNYYSTGTLPRDGLALARKIGHITYLSPEIMQQKFGREKAPPAAGHSPLTAAMFQVESYLNYQGEKFVNRFDANSYITISQAIDDYDLEERYGSLEKAFAPIQAKVLIVALSSDWLFPPGQSVELANALLAVGKDVSYCLLDAPQGHDAFLVDIANLSRMIRAFLPWVRRDPNPPEDAPDSPRRRDFRVIRKLIEPGSRVLDLGCGNGDLLTMLARERQTTGFGVDIDLGHVIDVIDKGHDIFQSNIDAGLSNIPDNSYDYAILSETLQVIQKPRLVLGEMLRVARRGIVSFPNFGQWTHRLRLGLLGSMPRGGSLPFEWYDTPNIHLFTLKDFIALCRKDGIGILDIRPLASGWFSRLLIRLGLHNLGADRMLVKIARPPAPFDSSRRPPAGRAETVQPRPHPAR